MADMDYLQTDIPSNYLQYAKGVSQPVGGGGGGGGGGGCLTNNLEALSCTVSPRAGC